MNGKLMFVPDTHVVVPKEPTADFIRELKLIGFNNAKDDYESIIQIAPQLTTPPVLRWGGFTLWMNGNPVAELHCWSDGKWSYELWRKESYSYNTEQEARRAAEKALGIPFNVEEI